jgi:hypothetical protein
MRHLISLMLVSLFIISCASNVRFVQTDETYITNEKPVDAKVVLKQGKIERPHRVIGVIEAQLGKKARRPQLDALLLKKAREIGADGLMLVEYDIDRNVYLERHHAIVGRGPWRRHVVRSHPRVAVNKTANAIAVVFK